MKGNTNISTGAIQIQQTKLVEAIYEMAEV